MPFLEKHLFTQTSGIPEAGLGLFTKVPISKGATIIEYTGKISSWEGADHQDGNNLYIYFINDNHVIDAAKRKRSLGRYANDARGLKKIKGFSNNAVFIEEGLKVYIVATKNIEADQEIFVSYGKEYWDVVKKNKED